MTTRPVNAGNFLSANLQVNRIPGLNQVLQSAQTGEASSATKVGADNSAPSTVSETGQLITKLQQLQQKDPAKFKQLAAKIATQLHAAAQNETQPGQKEALSNLADKFQHLAKGGAISQLQPSGSANRVASAYGPNQPAGQQGLLGVLARNDTSTMSPDSRKVLANILDEVNQAVAG
jgi:hypothetical protein